jgi:hypothetical protein
MSNFLQPTVQNIFKLYGEHYRNNHSLPYRYHKIINDILQCRSGSLGSHYVMCDTKECDYAKLVHNSCRNRHCAACQSYQSAQWVDAREIELLPASYFHIVFTIPHELNQLCLYNKKTMYDILFSSAWDSLSTLVSDAKHLGGKGGAIAVLHTWGQNLMDHPHIHMIVPGGAIDKNNKWVQRNTQKQFIVPYEPLKKLFKNKFIDRLKQQYTATSLDFPEEQKELLNPYTFNHFKEKLYQKKWVVHIKEPFAGPKQVLKYLGRYTHRIAISNSRIIDIQNGKITFESKNYAKNGEKQNITLSATEFIRRFLLHILPHQYRKIRMYGFLSNRSKGNDITLIRKSLDLIPAKLEKVKKEVHELILEYFGKNILECPKCKCNSLKLLSEINIESESG